MKVIDTFLFNKDFRTLEIRLNELWDIVDKFIIIESKYTHSGFEKPLYLQQNLKKFEAFSEKIVLISDTKKVFTKNARIREQYQRKRIDLEIRKLDLLHDDLIIHSDCDEIPRASVIQELQISNMVGKYLLELSNFSNYLNLYSGIWGRCTVTSYELFKGVLHARLNIFMEQAIQQQRYRIPCIYVPDFWTVKRFTRFMPVLRYNPNLIHIKDAGWHFNNLLSAAEIAEKIKSSSHTELLSKVNLDVEFIKLTLKQGRDVYTNKQMSKVPIDKSYPAFIRNNLEQFAEFIFD